MEMRQKNEIDVQDESNETVKMSQKQTIPNVEKM